MGEVVPPLGEMMLALQPLGQWLGVEVLAFDVVLEGPAGAACLL